MTGESIKYFKLVSLIYLGLTSCRSSKMDHKTAFRYSEKKMHVRELDFTNLNGWETDDHLKALQSFKKSCIKIINDGDFVASSQIIVSSSFIKEVCAAIPEDPNNIQAKLFFEEWFSPYKIETLDGSNNGKFTGYYETELEGSLTAECGYLNPIYGKPYDLPEDGSQYYSRKEIEKGKIRNKAPVLFWAKKASDVILLHIQGSGVVKTPDGKYYRIGYAGNNGYSFTGIGSILMKHKIKPKNGYSMNAVKLWLDTHPIQTSKLILENDRYIFFRDIDGEGPVGAMGVPLTPERSIAVDPEYIPLGLPIFLNTNDADGQKIEKLTIAQDVGAAIKGAIRADIFFGKGEKAFSKAGRQHSTGQYFILLPKNNKQFAIKK